tara:strand:- start:245 stop:889 length:645 start_codon:yes stop_codon:yes gene_type:complete
MKKVILNGLGTIGASVIEALPEMDLLGIVNDELEIGSTQGKYKKIPVIGHLKDLPKLIKPDDVFLIITYRDMKNERNQWEQLKTLNIPQDKYINVIHPSVIIPSNYCTIGKGVFMAPNVQLSTEITISNNCVFYGNSFIGHNTIIDEFVIVANHASIGARVKIGKGVHIGSNSTIREGVTVGEFSLIGLGSVVLNDIPKNSIVAGVPAKIIGTK